MRVIEEKRTEEGFRKKKEYIRKHLNEEMTAFHFRLNNKKDKDVISYLRKQKNKSKYIKDLIREDMNKGK